MNFEDEYLDKWEELFNSLPKFPSDHCPLAHETEEGESEWEDGVAIVVELGHYKIYGCLLALHLNMDRTAFFDVGAYANYDKVSEFIDFRGTWKDAYLKVIALMRKGWPELKIPTDQEILLLDLT